MASSSQHWHRVEGLFYEALDLAPEARKAFLEARCTGDEGLRREVESLLASADQPMDFLEKPVRNAARDVVQSSTPAVLTVGTRFARYEVVAILGAGGMGQVYLAHDVQLRRNVALKLLAPGLTRDARVLQRFEQEARAASALNHPNILTLYDFGHVEQTYYIASEYVEGETLRDRISKGRLGAAEVVDLSIQTCNALAAAHARGIVHRDIKPGNLMVRKDGIVKLLDFGIAKLSDDRDAATTLGPLLSMTDTGAVLGTVRYMSPEQARGQAVDGRSDLFSLGVVMYEMFTGEAPFQGETASDIIAEILKGDPAPLGTVVPGLPSQLEAIVHRLMRKNRSERYQTVAEMLHDLQAYRKNSEFHQQLQQSAGQMGVAPQANLPPKPVSRQISSPSPGATNNSTPVTERRRDLQWLVTAMTLLLLAAVVVIPWLRSRWSKHDGANAPRTMAVLPFRNLRPDPQTDFLGFSLADAIISKLSYVKALTVRPSSSVDKYRNQVIDPKRAASELSVGTLLTGTYIRDGDDLRITTQLVDVQPDKILWQDTIDLKYDRLLTLQDTVSQQIIKGLEVSLSPAEKEKLRPEPAPNSAAYEDYLRGVDLYSRDDYGGAIAMLEKAAAIDPNYAPTWAHLGRAYTTNASLQFGGREQYAKAHAAYDKAIALNPNLSEAKIYLANLLTDTGHAEEAVPLMRNVLNENPEYAEAHWELGYAYRFGGMLQEAAAESERARQNNPSVKINTSAMNAYLYLGEYEKFLQSLPASDSVYVLFYRGFGEYHLGQKAQAGRDFDRAFEQNPTLLPAAVGKALSDDLRGERQKGLELLHATEKRILDNGVADAEGLYKVAEAYAVLGDKASAILMFHRTVEGGFFPFPYFERDPLLSNLRDEAEFKLLMNEARERHERFKTQFFPAGR